MTWSDLTGTEMLIWESAVSRLKFRQEGFIFGNGVVPNGRVNHGERQCRPFEESFDSAVANRVDAQEGCGGE